MADDVLPDPASSNGAVGPGTSSGAARTTKPGEHHDSYGSTDFLPITQATYRFAFMAAINSCNLGFDIGVSTDAGRLIQEDFGLSRMEREIFVGSLNFFAMFGGLGAQFFTDRFGRRKTFIIAAIGFIVGIIIMIISNSYGALMFGRAFVGLAVGIGLAIDPLYIAEVSPAAHRGELVTWSEIALNLGICLGFSTGLFFSSLDNDLEWRVMFSLGLLMPLIMIFCVMTNKMPESPRWLVSKDRDDEARPILQQIYPQGYNVDTVIQDIREALEREVAAEKTVGWDVILSPTPAIRRMLLVGVGTAIAQQAVGIDAIQYYLLDVIDESGVEGEAKQSLVLIMLGVLKLVFIFVGGKLFDKRGRRPLFFISLSGMSVALFLVAIAFVASDSGLSTGGAIIGLAIYLSFFSIAMGPGAWLIPSEVFAPCMRAKAMSLATFLNRVTATIMSSTFLSTANAIGWGGFFFMLCMISLIVMAFLCFFLPETKGRSLEEMSVYFAELTGDSTVLEAEAAIARRHVDGVEMTATGGGGPASGSQADVEPEGEMA